jgi:hypothetical protein
MTDSSKALEKVAGLVVMSLSPWLALGWLGVAGAAVSVRNLLKRDS